LYFSLDSKSKTIHRGDELLVISKLSLPTLRGNPDEFDYPRYLIHKRISGTGFVSSGKWNVIAHYNRQTIQDYAFDCRDKVLSLYRELGFDGDNLAILSALTVGYKEELSESIRESFSISGASHVLALSGLHIGFLYILLLFLLIRIPGSSTGIRFFRVIVTVLTLWMFAFITGFSPSVIRSVIMFSLLGISQFSSERPISFNTLSVACMGMLIYNPSWLFDVGFQLSFLAVASILLIQPWLYGKLSFHNGFMDKIWALITVSIAAQVGAAPLVLLYFSRFSVHFLLTNILVIPLVTIIMYVAIAMLFLFFLPGVSRIIAYALNVLLDLLTAIVRGVERLPLASIDNLWIYRMEVILFYFTVIFLGWYIVKKQPKLLLISLVSLLTMFTYRVYMVDIDRPKQSLVFYNVRNCPVVHCVMPDGRSWLAYADSVPDVQRLTRVTSNYWNRLRLLTPIPVTSDFNGSDFIRHNNILFFGGKRVCIMNDNRWGKTKVDSPLTVDYLYLCKGFTGKLEKLTSVFNIKYLIVESTVSKYRQNMLRMECKRLGIPFISLSERSSYYKSLI